MKNVLYVMLFAVLALFSCKKDDVGAGVKKVVIKLVYPTNSNYNGSLTAIEGVKVKMTTSSSSYEAATNANGAASFNVPIGIYEASSSESRNKDGVAYAYNGVKSGITITDSWISTDTIQLTLTESQASQVVIKELYVGGVPKDDGSGSFSYDEYVILYNNSATVATLSNACLGITMPYNSTGSNKYIGTDGSLSYANSGWIPAGQAYWYFQSDISIDPGKQVVIALNNAVNNTITYSKSINFENAAYYCAYDITKFTHAATYVSPSAVIPTSHYLKAVTFGAGTAWTLSQKSPGFFLFSTRNTTPVAFGADVSVNDVYGGSGSTVSKKVPVSWIIDGVEAFELNKTNQKRLTAAIDAGYVYHTADMGYSIYRNVDKEATEAIAGNAGKLVYSYSYGTTSIGGSTDPSGIDAEKSTQNGARIVYKDSNNSTNDFHLRSQASLRK